jgi:hypothetical protein
MRISTGIATKVTRSIFKFHRVVTRKAANGQQRSPELWDEQGFYQDRTRQKGKSDRSNCNGGYNLVITEVYGDRLYQVFESVELTSVVTEVM